MLALLCTQHMSRYLSIWWSSASNYSPSHDFETSPNPSKNCPYCNLHVDIFYIYRHRRAKEVDPEQCMRGPSLPPLRPPPEQDAFTSRSPLPCLFSFSRHLSSSMRRGNRRQDGKSRLMLKMTCFSAVQYFKFFPFQSFEALEFLECFWSNCFHCIWNKVQYREGFMGALHV